MTPLQLLLVAILAFALAYAYWRLRRQTSKLEHEIEAIENVLEAETIPVTPYKPSLHEWVTSPEAEGEIQVIGMYQRDAGEVYLCVSKKHRTRLIATQVFPIQK